MTADPASTHLLEEIKADVIRAVRSPARCEGCGYWRPVETLTVVLLGGHHYRWCPGCNRDRVHHPEEIVTQEAAR